MGHVGGGSVACGPDDGDGGEPVSWVLVFLSFWDLNRYTRVREESLPTIWRADVATVLGAFVGGGRDTPLLRLRMMSTCLEG